MPRLDLQVSVFILHRVIVELVVRLLTQWWHSLDRRLNYLARHHAVSHINRLVLLLDLQMASIVWLHPNGLLHLCSSD